MTSTTSPSSSPVRTTASCGGPTSTRGAFPDLPGGFASPIPTRGDNAISVWSQGSGNIFENNISEGQSGAYAVTGLGTTAGNVFLGNISLDDFTGAFIEGGTVGTPPTVLPTGNRFENHVVVGSTRFGARFRTSRDSRCDNCTLIGTVGTGFVADESHPGGGQLTAYSDNTLVMGFPDRGFEFVSQLNWRVRFPNVFGNGTQYTPFPGNFENTREVDPQLGTCRVFIPASSPLKGAGLNGQDIGANILFRYENGTLTRTALWDLDGRFPCGAEVAGVNDSAGLLLLRRPHPAQREREWLRAACREQADPPGVRCDGRRRRKHGVGDRDPEPGECLGRDLRLGHRGRHGPFGKRLHRLEWNRNDACGRSDLDRALHPDSPGRPLRGGRDLQRRAVACDPRRDRGNSRHGDDHGRRPSTSGGCR